MAFDIENLNAYSFIKDFRGALDDRLEERLESGEFFPLLEAVRTKSTFESREAADAFYRNNGNLHPTKPVQGSKSGLWNVVHDQKKDSKSNKTQGMREEVEILEENVRKDATDIDWTQLGPEEKDVVLKLKETGRQMGSDPGAYASGVLMLTFKNKQAVNDYSEFLETADHVDTYEIEAVREDLVAGFVEDSEYDIDNIMFDKDFEFNVYIYLVPEIVMMPAEELEVGETFEWDEEADNGFLNEVRRRIKVNFRGKKRIKMQCNPGFKWDAAAKTCKKISGAQVAVMRKAMRRAVLTKKSMGQSFKARVTRKTRRAKRFRKSFGLK